MRRRRRGVEELERRQQRIVELQLLLAVDQVFQLVEVDFVLFVVVVIARVDDLQYRFLFAKKSQLNLWQAPQVSYRYLPQPFSHDFPREKLKWTLHCY